MLDHALAAETNGVPAPAQLRGLRFAVPKTAFQDELSPAVADAFTAALGRLSAAGATVVDLPMAEFAPAAAVNLRGFYGGLVSAEAYWWHRQWLKDGADKYDPRVIVRIRAGETVTAASYIDRIKLREQFIRTINAAAASYDAMLMPTTPETAPTIAEAGKDDETYFRLNFRMLRNTAVVNLFDGCALSVPCHLPGTAPVGLMIAGTQNTDHKIWQSVSQWKEPSGSSPANSDSRVSRRQQLAPLQWRMSVADTSSSFRDMRDFGRFWSEAEIGSPLPSRIYDGRPGRCCSNEPAARTIPPSKTKNPPLDRRAVTTAVTDDLWRARRRPSKKRVRNHHASAQINAERLDDENNSREYDFSPATIDARWRAGYADTCRVIVRRPWDNPISIRPSALLYTLPTATKTSYDNRRDVSLKAVSPSFVSVLKIPFPGNGDCGSKRLGSKGRSCPEH